MLLQLTYFFLSLVGKPKLNHWTERGLTLRDPIDGVRTMAGWIVHDAFKVFVTVLHEFRHHLGNFGPTKYTTTRISIVRDANTKALSWRVFLCATYMLWFFFAFCKRWCSVLQCVAVCCSVLAVCCSVLQCVAMYCPWCVMQV